MRNKTSRELTRLETHLGYWLRLVSNHISDEFARALQTRQVSVAEWVALRQLFDHEDISSGDLAQLLGITPGAISKIVDKLEGKGLVARITRSEDKRCQALALSLKGIYILPELVELADKNDERYFGCLESEERLELKSLLQKMARIHEWKDVPID